MFYRKIINPVTSFRRENPLIRRKSRLALPALSDSGATIISTTTLVPFYPTTSASYKVQKTEEEWRNSAWYRAS
ncbi:unnamed protein product, partial [Allacma fusca]